MDIKEIKQIRMKIAINNLLSDIKNKTFPVEKIILFGSVAKNNIHERSDMDICIVADSALEIRQMREIENYFYEMAQGEYSMDYIYCDTEKLMNGDRVFEHIRKDGRIIYDRV